MLDTADIDTLAGSDAVGTGVFGSVGRGEDRVRGVCGELLGKYGVGCFGVGE